MTDTLVDTNVLIDLSGEDPVWSDWSARAVESAANQGALLINQVIYSELSGGYASREDLEVALTGAHIRREHLPWDAAFLAGLVFRSFKGNIGTPRTPLPDFYIGAHAAVRGYQLLTRDRGYYRPCFPGLSVISPDTHP